MPIEILQTPDDTQKRRLLGYVNPDTFFVALDHLESGETVAFSVYCLPDDDGMEVYEFDHTELGKDDPGNPKPMGLDPESNKAFKIDCNTSFERRITTGEGDRATLLFKHMGAVAGRSMN